MLRFLFMAILVVLAAAWIGSVEVYCRQRCVSAAQTESERVTARYR